MVTSGQESAGKISDRLMHVQEQEIRENKKKLAEIEIKLQGMKKIVAEIEISGAEMNKDIKDMMCILTSCINQHEDSGNSRQRLFQELDASVEVLRSRLEDLDARVGQNSAMLSSLKLLENPYEILQNVGVTNDFSIAEHTPFLINHVKPRGNSEAISLDSDIPRLAPQILDKHSEMRDRGDIQAQNVSLRNNNNQVLNHETGLEAGMSCTNESSVNFHPKYAPDSFVYEDHDDFDGPQELPEPEESIGNNISKEVISIEIMRTSEENEMEEMELGCLESPDNWYWKRSGTSLPTIAEDPEENTSQDFGLSEDSLASRNSQEDCNEIQKQISRRTLLHADEHLHNHAKTIDQEPWPGSKSASDTSVLDTGDAFMPPDVPQLGNDYPFLSAPSSVSIEDTRTCMEDHEDIMRDSADSEVLKEAFKVVRALNSEISLDGRYFLSQCLDPDHQHTQKPPTVAMPMLHFNENLTFIPETYVLLQCSKSDFLWL